MQLRRKHILSDHIVEAIQYISLYSEGCWDNFRNDYLIFISLTS